LLTKDRAALPKGGAALSFSGRTLPVRMQSMNVTFVSLPTSLLSARLSRPGSGLVCSERSECSGGLKFDFVLHCEKIMPLTTGAAIQPGTL
jgi:hypothetical protein